MLPGQCTRPHSRIVVFPAWSHNTTLHLHTHIGRNLRLRKRQSLYVRSHFSVSPLTNGKTHSLTHTSISGCMCFQIIVCIASMCYHLFPHRNQVLKFKRFGVQNCQLWGSKIKPFCTQNRIPNRLRIRTSEKEASKRPGARPSGAEDDPRG